MHARLACKFNCRQQLVCISLHAGPGVLSSTYKLDSPGVPQISLQHIYLLLTLIIDPY